MCDHLLVDTIYPIVLNLLRSGLISRWFFIRYGDPEFHLRLRVELIGNNVMPIVLKAFNKNLLPLCHQRRLHKIVVDTYKRELERYGRELMDVTETLFNIDSHCICRLLNSHFENDRWKLAFVWIDRMLDALGYTLESKHELINRMSKGYLGEFGFNEHNIKPLAYRYRQLRQHIANLLNGKVFDDDCEKTMSLYSIKMSKVISNNNISSLRVESLLHMSMNRLFPTKNRLCEMTLYYCLEKHYNSALKRKNTY